MKTIILNKSLKFVLLVTIFWPRYKLLVLAGCATA